MNQNTKVNSLGDYNCDGAINKIIEYRKTCS